jgi:DeoR family fructose operon transcriptional repressor
MFGHERRQQIMTWAKQHGRINVKEVARSLAVTTETVRRDLTDLEQRGLVRRVHGGAILTEQATLEPEVFTRSVTMTAEKRRIAARAVTELPGEGVVYVDAGTTAGHLADLVPQDCRATIVTNSLPFALNAVSTGRRNVMLIGGHIRPITLASVGPWSIRDLDRISVDVAFMATNGLSVRRGLTTPNPDEAATKRAAVNAAGRVILLADHSKIGRDYLETFADLDQIGMLITDSGARSDDVAALRQEGLAVEAV